MYPWVVCNAQIKSRVQKSPLTTESKSNADATRIKKLNDEIEKPTNINYINKPKFEESKSLWCEWVTSDEYPNDIAVRYSQLKYDNITLEIKNTGYGTVVGDFFASDCQLDNGNSSGYKKINIEAGKSKRITFNKKNCNSNNKIQWWWKNLFVWSPKKKFGFGCSKYTSAAYSSLIRWAQKDNNQFILEIQITAEPPKGEGEKGWGPRLRGEITACFCYDPYSFINGWQYFDFTVGNVYYFEFTDRSTHCGWEAKDIQISFKLKENQF